MAGVNPFIAAATAMILAMVLPGCIAFHGSTPQRLVAVQLAAVITALVLVCLSLGFGQPSFLDLAVTLELLSLPGTLALIVCLERWL